MTHRTVPHCSLSTTQGFVHRDIKPENFFVTAHNNKPLVQLADFGCADRCGANDSWGDNRYRARLFWAVVKIRTCALKDWSHGWEVADMLPAINQPRGDVWSAMMVLVWWMLGELPRELDHNALAADIKMYPERQLDLERAFGEAHSNFDCSATWRTQSTRARSTSTMPSSCTTSSRRSMETSPQLRSFCSTATSRASRRDASRCGRTSVSSGLSSARLPRP